MRRRVRSEEVRTAWPAWMGKYCAEAWPDGPQSWYDAAAAWCGEHPEVELPILLGLAYEDNPPAVPWDGTGY